jgi:CRISPR-associated protein Cmr4
MNTYVFKITAKTNLHVGNESGGDFTIIDKAIQRDPLTGLPCINSSSLKGAINEFCSNGIKMPADERKTLFGSDKIDKKGDSQKGEAIFFDAKLLFLPQQDEQTLYHYVTSDNIITMLNDRVKLFNPSFNFAKPTNYHGKTVETENEKLSALCNDDNLPIIARNVLDNGESKNLWYEQVLPAETVLYTIIQENEDKLAKALDGQIVQIGANATIGYGYCKFELMK